MHGFAKFLCILALALALTAYPAQPIAAQEVSGVGLSRLEIVVLQSVAREDGYRQIPSSYPKITQKLRELGEVYRSQREREAERGDRGHFAGILSHSTFERMGEVQKPLIRAQIYVIEQIIAALPQSYAAVSRSSGIGLIVPPNNVLFAAQGLTTRDMPVMDDLIVAELNRRLPAVSVVPPEDYKPSANAENLHLRIGGLLKQIEEQKAKEGQS